MLNEIDVDRPYANANAASPAPCCKIATSSQIIDSAMLRGTTRDTSPESLSQSLINHQVLVDRNNIVHDTGFILSEGNRVAEVEKAPSQMVTNHEFVHRTQCGAFTEKLSCTELAMHSQTDSREPMNDTRMLESDLHQLELNLTVDPIPETYFSKSFMANKEVPQIIR